ncbi:MAG: hypothetical protein ABTR07_05810 [Candidatus Competibacter denitrificans]
MNRNQARDAGRQLLGDRVAAGLQKLGADQLAQTYTRLTGRPCGCEERTAAINAWDARRSKS